ncbi:MAG: Gfo/Idh/MocA family oxidoreductase [Clostridia bacterium]|nr:Gfo/Idh/MocA family oxidoreductase [Clostridia bacterium]
MKKITATVLGCGNRGQAYADYTFSHPEELEIVSVIDIDNHAMNFAKERYSVKQENVFKCLEDFLAKKIECDIVINATQDPTHYVTTMQLLNAGYNVLLEKPVTANPTELLDIERLAKEKGLKVIVCHVLRYAPVYKNVKKILNSGRIGEIISIEANEHVGLAHCIESFIRGPWKSEDECGSSFLLAKCCHDLDLLCWLNNGTKPKSVVSFGSRSNFVTKKRPSDATEFCYNCPHVTTCLYSAIKVHLEYQMFPFQTYAELVKKYDKIAEDISQEVKYEYLKTSEFGRCAYYDRNLIDRQSVNIEFENGSIVNFALIAGTPRADRYFHIVGTKGEIEGKFDDKKISIRHIDNSPNKYDMVEEIIDYDSQIIVNEKYGGHGGGDYAIMHDLVRYLNGEGETISLTNIEDSINGHFCVYAADESRKTGKVISFNEFMKEKS